MQVANTCVSVRACGVCVYVVCARVYVCVCVCVCECIPLKLTNIFHFEEHHKHLRFISFI
jgi:hypothetical protein